MNKANRKFLLAYGSLMNEDKIIQVCPEAYVFGVKRGDGSRVSLGETSEPSRRFL